MSPSPSPVVSAIIVSYNTCALLRDCLRSVEAARVDEVIVVDNASEDGSPEMVEREFPNVRLIRNARNTGFGPANNQAVAVAQGRYLLLLNSDTRINPGAVGALISALEADPAVGLVAPRLVNDDGTPQRSAAPMLTPLNLALEQLGWARDVSSQLETRNNRPPNRRFIGYLKGAALLGRADVLRSFGPFDPRFFMYCEDVDLCYRMQQAGLRVTPVSDAVITHVSGQSSKQHYEAMAVHAIASTYLFYRKHYGNMSLCAAVAIVRAVCVLKWLRDGVACTSARVRHHEAEERSLRRDLRVWRQISALAPPPKSAVART